MISLVFFSCQAKTTIPSLGQNTNTAKSSDSKKNSKLYTISGKVQQVSPYCGGARPSQEMLDRLAIPVDYPGKKFYVRRGKINTINTKIVSSFISGKEGEFSIQLEPGTYSIILEEQLNEIKAEDYVKQYQQVDTQCLKEWWIQPYYLLEVKEKTITDLNFVFQHRCFISVDLPCITYTGPLPP